jgi:hypothetical protein
METWQAMDYESTAPTAVGITYRETGLYPQWYLDDIEQRRRRAIAEVRQCDAVLYGTADYTIKERRR